MKKFTVVYQDQSENESYEVVDADFAHAREGSLTFTNAHGETIRAYAPGYWRRVYEATV